MVLTLGVSSLSEAASVCVEGVLDSCHRCQGSFFMEKELKVKGTYIRKLIELCVTK